MLGYDLVTKVGRVANHKQPLSERMLRRVEQLEEIFLAEGFLHFSTEDLARRLRCSKRTLYTLAPSREGLFELVIDRVLGRIRDNGTVAAQRAENCVEAVAGYLDAGVRGTRKASAAFVRDLNTMESGLRRLRAHQLRRVEGLEKIVSEGVSEGAFADLHAKLVAEVLVTAAARMSDPGFLSQCGLSMSEAFEELFRLVEFGLIPRDGAEEKKPRTRPAQASDGAPSPIQTKAGFRNSD